MPTQYMGCQEQQAGLKYIMYRTAVIQASLKDTTSVRLSTEISNHLLNGTLGIMFFFKHGHSFVIWMKTES